jgi:hypothetical protein
MLSIPSSGRLALYSDTAWQNPPWVYGAAARGANSSNAPSGQYQLARIAKTLRTFFFVLVSTVISPQLTCCARVRKNKNITKKDPPQQPHHGFDKKIDTEDSSHWCPHPQRSGAHAC